MKETASIFVSSLIILLPSFHEFKLILSGKNYKELFCNSIYKALLMLFFLFPFPFLLIGYPNVQNYIFSHPQKWTICIVMFLNDSPTKRSYIYEFRSILIFIVKLLISSPHHFIAESIARSIENVILSVVNLILVKRKESIDIIENFLLEVFVHLHFLARLMILPIFLYSFTKLMGS